MDPIFFRTAAELRDWFDEHHGRAAELSVGMWKAGSGEIGVTWREAPSTRRSASAGSTR